MKTLTVAALTLAIPGYIFIGDTLFKANYDLSETCSELYRVPGIECDIHNPRRAISEQVESDTQPRFPRSAAVFSASYAGSHILKYIHSS